MAYEVDFERFVRLNIQPGLRCNGSSNLGWTPLDALYTNDVECGTHNIYMGYYVSATPLIGEMPACVMFIIIGHQRGAFHVQKAFALRIDKAELINIKQV